MNVEIGAEAPIFLFWESLFQIFGILSLQCACTEVIVFYQQNEIRTLFRNDNFLRDLRINDLRVDNFLRTIIADFIKHSASALQRHNTKNSKQIFPWKELRGYSPNS
jgi:hypothetical protein